MHPNLRADSNICVGVSGSEEVNFAKHIVVSETLCGSGGLAERLFGAVARRKPRMTRVGANGATYLTY